MKLQFHFFLLNIIGLQQTWASYINSKNTKISLNTERSLIKKINGDCLTPIAALAKVKNNSIILKARLFSDNGKSFVDDIKIGSIKSANSLGKKCADNLLKKLKAIE